MFGELKIVASSEGELESEPVYVTWSVRGNFKGLLLWLPLVLSIGLVRANRSRQVLWLVIPVVLAKVGMALLAVATSMPASIAGIFEYVAFGPLVVGLSVILLMGDTLGRRAKPITWGMSVLILLLAHAVGLLAYGHSDELGQGLIFVAIMDSTILLAVPLTARCCRKRYSGPRLGLWLAVWTVVFSLVTVGIYGISDSWGSPSLSMAVQVLLAALVFAGILFFIQLPFVLLGTLNSFYRPRFMGLVGVVRQKEGSEEGRKIRREEGVTVPRTSSGEAKKRSSGVVDAFLLIYFRI